MTHYIKKTNVGVGTYSCDWPGGPGWFAAQGTWNGGIAKLRFSLDGTNHADFPGTELTFTSDDLGGFHIGPCKITVDVSDAGGAAPSLKLLVTPSFPGWFYGTTLADT